MSENQRKNVEVRGMSFIKELFDQRGFPFPFFVDLSDECTAGELAERLDIPANLIEAVFVNGIAGGVEQRVKPGDRVAFIPPGTPGPYRVILGIAESARRQRRK